MVRFIKLFEKYLHLYEEVNQPTGKEVVYDFYKNAPKALNEIIKKYFEAVTKNAIKYKAKDLQTGDIITPEQFIATVIEPLAIDNKDNYVVELPVNFTPEMFKDFIRGLSEISKQDLPDLIEIDPTEIKYADKNIFSKVNRDLLKHIYPGHVKTIDRTNYPGGEIAYRVLKHVEPEALKEVLKSYRLEHTQPLDPYGDPNNVLTFLVNHVFPLLKAHNWPIKDYKSVDDVKKVQKWASVYLMDFLKAAQLDTANDKDRFIYQPATAWRGVQNTYAFKQKIREFFDEI